MTMQRTREDSNEGEDTVMGRKVMLLVLLMAGSCAYAPPAWAASAGSAAVPPEDVVGTIRVVDRVGNRIVMEERSLEVWAADPRQLNGLVEGQKVRLRFQRQDGRQVIYSIAPLSK
jgi:hypothetical protein